jgi:hypothetical protein
MAQFAHCRHHLVEPVEMALAITAMIFLLRASISILTDIRQMTASPEPRLRQW